MSLFKIAGIAAGLAALAVAPSAASALEPLNGPPGSRCLITTGNGTMTWYDEGSTLTVTDPQGNKTTYKCVAGSWIKTSSMTTATGTYTPPTSSYTRLS
jgi:hypothetical protein